MTKGFIISLLLCCGNLMAQKEEFVSSEGIKSKLVASFTDERGMMYMIEEPCVDAGFYKLCYIELPVCKTGLLSNPYAIEDDAVSDAKLVGDNLYVINTSCRSGENLARLNTWTGKWSNPIKACVHCEFIGNNRVKVTFAERVKAENRVTFRLTEKMFVLK